MTDHAALDTRVTCELAAHCVSELLDWAWAGCVLAKAKGAFAPHYSS
jgi:hypothetical protein